MLRRFVPVVVGWVLSVPAIAASAIDPESLVDLEQDLVATALPIMSSALVVLALVLGMTKGLQLLKRLFGSV